MAPAMLQWGGRSKITIIHGSGLHHVQLKSDLCLPFFSGMDKTLPSYKPLISHPFFFHSKILLGGGECCLQATHAGRPVISMLNSPSQGTIGCTPNSVQCTHSI